MLSATVSHFLRLNEHGQCLAHENIAYREERDILRVLFPRTQVAILHATLRVVIQITWNEALEIARPVYEIFPPKNQYRGLQYITPPPTPIRTAAWVSPLEDE